MFSFLWKIVQFPFKKFAKLKRKHKIIVIILLCIGVVIFLIVRSKRNGSAYLTEFPKREKITEIVSETGNITTSARVDVYSTTNGVVDKVFVTNGQIVKAGDSLFSVKSTASLQEKNTARSNYLAGKNALEVAQATQYSLQAAMFDAWDSYKNLAENDTYEDDKGLPKISNRTLPEFVISQKEWLAAEAQYKAQTQKIAQSQAYVNATWEAYQATQDNTVKSTIAGTIYNIGVSETDAVSIKGVAGSTPVLVLADLSKIRIKTEINEVDISKVAVGQKVTIEVDALSNKQYQGVVESVDTLGTNTLGVVTYNVYITITNADLLIKPGMTVSVDITVAEKENVLTVSSSAVRPHEGKKAVQVINQKTKKPDYIPVEIGLKGKGRTEIVSGIDESTSIITALKNEQVKRSNSGFFSQ